MPNPATRLAQLLARFKDDDGRLLVDGFYAGIDPLRPEEQQMLDAVPDDPAQLKALFGISVPENSQRTLQESLQVPSFKIRGLSSGFVGERARTIRHGTLHDAPPVARDTQVVVAAIAEREGGE